MNGDSTNSVRQTADEFLLSCLHDIRLHLRRSVTRTQMIERESADSLAPDVREHLSEIMSAGRDMDVLLTRLAQFAVAGSAVNDAPLGDVGVMFDAAMRRLLKENVDAEISGQSIHSCGAMAPYSFEAVMRELMDNALKFRKGPVRITILVEESDGKKMIGVQDTGIGFESQYCEKIMRPLERLHPTSTYPGCGLGLAICQRTIESWGGKIWAESKLGGGSTFWFSLPA